ncbi:helix-turn-helix transcriptional regulator [Vreelandella aquamarina]
MSQQLQRQWVILRVLSAKRRPLTVSDIYAELKDQFDVTLRTYERDLTILESTFPQVIVRQEGQGKNRRTIYWSLSSQRGLIPEVLFNDANIAMALVILEEQARSRLPRSVMQHLNGWWEQAHGTLDNVPDTHLTSLHQLIRYIPNPERSVHPSADDSVQLTVENALIQQQKLTLTHETLDGPRTLEGLVPLRLLFLEEVMYLIAEQPESTSAERIYKIPLHRVTNAICTGLNTTALTDPDSAERQVMGTGGKQPIEMPVPRSIAEMLFERPLGYDQTLTPFDDGEAFMLKTTLDDSHQLQDLLGQTLAIFTGR